MEGIVKFSKFLKESKKEVFPNIKKFEIDNFVVIVGKDAKSNDYLTFIEAGDDDVWMHVKGVPGSHVVIKVKENIPTESVIKKAAEMAKKNSKAPKDEKANVVYCKRKFVRKTKEMNPGQVSVDYKNASEISI